MKSMKRVLALTIVLAMLLSLIPTAYADTTVAVGTKDNPTEISSYEQLVTAAAQGGYYVLNTGITVTGQINVNADFYLDGGEHQITVENSGPQKLFVVGGDSAPVVNNFELSNLKIVMSSAGARAVDARPSCSSVVLKSVEIDTTQATYAGESKRNQAINNNAATLKLENCTVKANPANGYAIVNWVESDITIDNSKISGYTALYIKAEAENSTVDIIGDSELGSTGQTGQTNSFGTIVLEGVKQVTINVDEGSVVSTGSQQSVILFKTSGNTNKIIVKNAETKEEMKKQGIVFDGDEIAPAAVYNDTEYATFDAALEAALDEGGTIYLLADAVITYDSFELNKEIYIAQNGHEVKANDNTEITIGTGGALTTDKNITDGTGISVKTESSTASAIEVEAEEDGTSKTLGFVYGTGADDEDLNINPLIPAGYEFEADSGSAESDNKIILTLERDNEYCVINWDYDGGVDELGRSSFETAEVVGPSHSPCVSDALNNAPQKVVKAGSTFVEWTVLKSDNENEEVTDESALLSETGDLTIKAVWEENSSTEEDPIAPVTVYDRVQTIDVYDADDKIIWKKGSGVDLVIHFPDAPYRYFSGLMVDKTNNKYYTDYTVEDGVYLIINAEYLETLSVDGHDIRLFFTRPGNPNPAGGIGLARFTIVE